MAEIPYREGGAETAVARSLRRRHEQTVSGPLAQRRQPLPQPFELLELEFDELLELEFDELFELELEELLELEFDELLELEFDELFELEFPANWMKFSGVFTVVFAGSCPIRVPVAS
jgi:hypothetical protein